MLTRTEDASVREPEDQQSVFVWTERMVYRPGETVRFRLFQRTTQPRAVRASEASQRVSLQIGDGWRPGQSLHFELDEFGAASGSWQIPTGAPDTYYWFSLAETKDGELENFAGFRVASVDPAELEVSLDLPAGTFSPATLPELSVSARYFSGGPAVALESRVEGMLDVAYQSPLRDAFPKFAFFSDVEAADDAAERVRLKAEQYCDGDSYASLLSVSVEQRTGRTDAKGRSAATTLVLPDFKCPLGVLKLSPVVRPAGLPESYGQTITRLYSRKPALLGLKLPYWSRTGSPVELDAQAVRMTDLRALGDQPIQLSFEHWRETIWESVQLCMLGGAHVAQRCTWAPQIAGRWRVVATAPGFTPLKRSIEVWGSTLPTESAARLDGPTQAILAGSKAQYQLRQPYSEARVLLSIESDGLLDQQWHQVSGTEVSLDLQTKAEWGPCFHVAALVLPVTAPGQSLLPSLAASTKTCLTPRQNKLVEMTLEPNRTRPGGYVRVRVRSLHSKALTLSLTAIDAGVLNLDPDLRAQRDPHVGTFLHRTAAGEPAQSYSLQAWARTAAAQGDNLPGIDLAELERERLEQLEYRRLVQRFPGEELQPIMVTGSHISAADVFMEFGASKGQRPELIPVGSVTSLSERWRRILRSQFAESAFWLPAERLEPAQTREFNLKLPDNLTRWHVELLAADAADQFQLLADELEVGLPLEARALAPQRVFVGDHATVGAELRNATEAAVPVQAVLEFPGTKHALSQPRNLPARQAARMDLSWQAVTVGATPLLARLEALNGSAADAMLREIRVESRFAPWVQRQSGLLLQPVTQLELARLLAPGVPAQLQLRLSRNPLFGLSGLFAQMRDYPHRCLEQLLSRALVAQQARDLADLAGIDPAWATQQVIDAPRDNLARYIGYDDGLVYFDPNYESSDPQLMQYALLAFAELGYKLPKVTRVEAVKSARLTIKAINDAKTPAQLAHRSELAAQALRALSVSGTARGAEFQQVLERAPHLGVWGTSQLVHALGERPAYTVQRAAAVLRLRALGVRDGPRIRLAKSTNSSWLDSDARDTCDLLGALVQSDQAPDAHAEQAAWLYGILDAYGAALPSWDTQSMASCAVAIGAYAKRWLRASDTVPVKVYGEAVSLFDGVLSDSKPLLEYQQSLAASARPRLRIEVPHILDLSFELQLTQQRDLLSLPAASQGLVLERTAEVWRGQQWLALPGPVVRVGDWLRVRLAVQASGPLSMVAVSDTVPGGLRAIDKRLEGVSDPQIQVADEGSFWFFERQLSVTDARFYATNMPAGQQEIIYYTQARHAGRYAWPGARAELMYAPQRYGRTAASVLEILPAE